MKKFIVMLVLCLTGLLTQSCTQSIPTTTQSTTSTTTKDQSWKIVYDVADSSPDFLNNVSVCYQVFPIAFADSNDDGYGDLNGVRNALDYLANQLQVDCIWLNPINPSPTYHKYDVTNYYGIDPQFGTMEDFEQLITDAKNAGIRILMDLVINHTAKTHPWFINSSNGPSATYRDYYVWNDLSDRKAFPIRNSWYLYNGSFYFASFWSEMPELNFDNPALRQEIKDIATFWLNKGVSGFRIDAAKHLYDTNEYPVGTKTLQENVHFFREFNAHIKQVNPDAFMVGEVYVNNSSFVANFYEGMDSAFNFEFAEKLISSLMSGQDMNAISSLIAARSSFSQKRSDYIDSIFITNHYQDRIYDRLGGNVDKLKLAAHITMTLPGISWIYYGEELGMSGVKPDSMIRQPFSWGNELLSWNTKSKASGIGSWNSANLALTGMSEQLIDSNSLLNSYRSIIAFRQLNPILSQGDLLGVDRVDNRIMSYVRVLDEMTVLVIHNLSSQSISAVVNASDMVTLYQTHPITLQDQTILFQPYSTTIFQISNSTVTLRNP